MTTTHCAWLFSPEQLQAALRGPSGPVDAVLRDLAEEIERTDDPGLRKYVDAMCIGADDYWVAGPDYYPDLCFAVALGRALVRPASAIPTALAFAEVLRLTGWSEDDVRLLLNGAQLASFVQEYVPELRDSLDLHHRSWGGWLDVAAAMRLRELVNAQWSEVVSRPDDVLGLPAVQRYRAEFGDRLPFAVMPRLIDGYEATSRMLTESIDSGLPLRIVLSG